MLFRHDTTGALYAWLLRDSTVAPFTYTQARALNPGALSDLGWKLRATGSFNGDQVPDIVWHHATQDYVAVWLMQDDGANKGTKVLDSVLTSPNAVDADTWKIVGSGDFNGDGKSELVWQDQVEGWLAIWLLDGVNLPSGNSVSPYPNRVADLNWKIVGVGDFNRDGKSDLVWRDTTPGAGGGSIVVWLMNGTTLQQSVATTPDTLLLTFALMGPK